MLFSSREPFNDDPEPFVSGMKNRHSENFNPSVWTHEPRPEYDRQQHNPTNPILTEFRRLVKETGNGVYVTAWMFSGDLLEESASYPLEEWHHAMDVLEKILSIYKEQSQC